MVRNYISVFEYSDYRQFLNDYYQQKKRRKGSCWGLRVWAKALNLRSPSTILMVLQGKRNPSQQLVKRLIDSLQLNKSEGEYFSDLILLKRNEENPLISLAILERLKRKSLANGYLNLDLQVFEYISNWYHYAIREMTNLPSFIEDPKWIANKLKPFISKEQIESSINVLLKLRLLRRQRNGTLVIDPQHVGTDSDIPSAALKRYHSQILRLAQRCLTSTPLSQREVTGATLSMHSEKLPKAKELIRKFKEDFIDLMEDSKKCDSVYHLELAFFPLTNPERNHAS